MRGLTCILRSILRYPRRYRTSRGFGVHSPFAFSFITGVLRDRTAYFYAYPEIDNLFSSKRMRLKGRMLFRILCRFNPRQIILIGEEKESDREIIRLATPHAEISHPAYDSPVEPKCADPCFIIVNRRPERSVAAIRSYLLNTMKRPSGVTIYFPDITPGEDTRNIWEQLMAVSPFGMSFHNDRIGIFAASSKLPRKDFEILL